MSMVWPQSPAGVNTTAHTDQEKAARTPIDTSVSMVAAPWRALITIARWKGQAAQIATGAVSAITIHCQPSNCSAPIIEIASTGAAKTAATTRRTSRSCGRSSPWSWPSWPFGSACSSVATCPAGARTDAR